MYFVGDDEDTGVELWGLNDTETGIVLIADILEGTNFTYSGNYARSSHPNI